jgi:hypothetical protein
MLFSRFVSRLFTASVIVWGDRQGGGVVVGGKSDKIGGGKFNWSIGGGNGKGEEEGEGKGESVGEGTGVVKALMSSKSSSSQEYILETK